MKRMFVVCFLFAATIFQTLIVNSEVLFKYPEKVSDEAYFEYGGKKIDLRSFFARVENGVGRTEDSYLVVKNDRIRIYLTDRVYIAFIELNKTIYSDKISNLDSFVFDVVPGCGSFYFDNYYNSLWFALSSYKKTGEGYGDLEPNPEIFGYYNFTYDKIICLFTLKDFPGMTKMPYIYKVGKIENNSILLLTALDSRIGLINYIPKGTKLFLYKYWDKSLSEIEIKYK